MKKSECTRKLGAIEMRDYLLNAIKSTQFTIHSQIEGNINEKNLCEALAALQARHSLLQVRIVRHGWWGARFDGAAVGAIPFSIIKAKEDQWVDYIESEIGDRMSTESGPLCRCLVLSHTKNLSTLLLTFHHSIADGLSGVHAMRDLISALDDVRSKRPVNLPPLEPVSAIEQQFPAHAKGAVGVVKYLAFSARSILRDIKAGTPCMPNPDYADANEIPLENRTTCIVHRELEPVVVMRLRDCSRREGISINALLNAAYVLAVARLQSVKTPVHFRIAYDVSMRDRVDDPLGERVGNFLSALVSTHRVTADTDPITLAREIKVHMERAIARDEHFIGVPKFFQNLRIIPFLFGNREKGARRYASLYLAMSGGLCMSNIGNLAIKTAFSCYRILKTGFAVSMPAYASLNLLVATLDGRLCLNMHGAEPIYSRDHITHIAEKTIEILDGIG